MLGSMLTEWVSLVIANLQLLVIFLPKHPVIYTQITTVYAAVLSKIEHIKLIQNYGPNK